MKRKTLLSILAFGLIFSAFCQKSTIELTFTAEQDGQHVPLDSIVIKNLTQPGDTTLYAPDTVFVLEYSAVSISDNQAIDENSFSVSQNYPNPFKGKTEVNLYLPQKEDITISVHDILGRELAQYKNTLNQGNHSFLFYSGNEKYYLLTVTGKETSKTIKMLNANTITTWGGKCKIVYNKFEAYANSFKSQTVMGGFTFSLEDELKYSAWSDEDERTIFDSPTDNQTYTFEYASGVPCPGMPLVSDIDENHYNTVLIGNQCWMTENLITTTYQNGTPIPNVMSGSAWGNLTTGAYVWYNNDLSWKDHYGAIYNWHAVSNSNGLCPTGWHVATNEEWIILTDFIGGIESPHGNELKSCRQVNSPLGGNCNTSEHPRWQQHSTHYGTDDFNFSCLPGGNRNDFGMFVGIETHGTWWTSTPESSSFAWFRFLSYGNGGMAETYSGRRCGYSVRCLRD